METEISEIVAHLARSWKSITDGELTLILPGYVSYGDRIDSIPPEIKKILQGKSEKTVIVDNGKHWWVIKEPINEGEISVVAWAEQDGPWGKLLPSWASLLSIISIEKTVSHDLALELVKAWDRLTFHFEMTKIIGRTSDLDEMLDSIVISLTEVMGRGEVFLATENEEEKISIITSGIELKLNPDSYRSIARSHKPLSFSEIKEFLDSDELFLRTVSDMIVAPLVCSEGACGLIGFIKLQEGEYDASDAQLLASVAEHLGALIEASRIRNTREEQRRLERELSIASEIQSSLLPVRLPVVRGCELSAHLQPARRVGGDFYDVAHIRSGEPIIMLADVSGKGMPAAILTAVVHATFHGEAPYQRDPSQLLAEINRSIYADLDKAQAFVTAAVARIDTNPLGIAYASAGHVEAAIWRKEQLWIEFLPATGLPLGVQRILSCRTKEINLDPGDVLLLYSDGVTEAEDSAGDIFGAQRLSDIMEAVHPASAEIQIKTIIEAVETFCGKSPIRDDLTMVLVRAKARDTQARDFVPFVISSESSEISPFVKWVWEQLSKYLPDENRPELVDEFTLALSEVVTNQSEHAYGNGEGLIMGRLSLSKSLWQVDLYDRGVGFDPFTGKDFSMNLDDPPLDGYGLRIIQTALDGCNYDSLEDGRNHWTLTKQLSGDDLE
jgi:serine phosphatase RsbU (regulator of sigma subunit)/anti-sigma regulatory factor (Ser/Thr protein kinase)